MVKYAILYIFLVFSALQKQPGQTLIFAFKPSLKGRSLHRFLDTISSMINSL